ncbi:MAG: hypothetical protein OEO83_18475, partial [Alphaproteobacteria bacterium]|nr:hypothetical protein [Alphaproteobacteria bacterium]
MQTDQAYGSDGFGRDEADPQGLPERSVGPFASSNLPLFTDAIEGSGTPIRRFLFAYGALPV